MPNTKPIQPATPRTDAALKRASLSYVNEESLRGMQVGELAPLCRQLERELQAPSSEAVEVAKEWLPVLEQELLNRKGPLLTRPFITLAKEILRLANQGAE